MISLIISVVLFIICCSVGMVVAMPAMVTIIGVLGILEVLTNIIFPKAKRRKD